MVINVRLEAFEYPEACISRSYSEYEQNTGSHRLSNFGHRAAMAPYQQNAIWETAG